MRKPLTQTLLAALLFSSAFHSCRESSSKQIDPEELEEAYSSPQARYQLEFDKTKDPALNYVPSERLHLAIEYTIAAKQNNANRTDGMLWQERGPIYDFSGPSNGEVRGYTAGRIRAVLIDTLNDPTGNTVFCGGITGGLWKSTNFLAPVITWTAVNDYFDNLAVSSICQDPSNPSIMYFATGEGTANSNAVLGLGIWKSFNAGATWIRLPNTAHFRKSFKILCDNAGNVFLATHPLVVPALQTASLLRSKDGGIQWTDITPTGIGNPHPPCTDIEISSTGRLHGSFGYFGTTAYHRYTSDPANVTSATWNASTGIRSSPGAPQIKRMELACIADTLYAITTNTVHMADSIYKSVDGGATWTKQNDTELPINVTGGQGWYNLTLIINPKNTSEIIAGGLDAFKSANSGRTLTQITRFGTLETYVHVDHHFLHWWHAGGESRVLIGCDGGLFFSRNGGSTFTSRNHRLAIKQFYSCTIHPAAGSNYMLAGSQDNGTHQFKNPGLSFTTEVTPGDGGFTHINQVNPQIQITSLFYNNYYRSFNGGQTWQLTSPGGQGLFINPFDYDDVQNIMYMSNAPNSIRRWQMISNTTNVIASASFGFPSAIKLSPHTPNRLFIGSTTGGLIRLDNAHSASDATVHANLVNLRGASFSNGFLNCINTGTSDDHLVAVFSNYGINNVWYSSNGGISWSAIDGNLPDMPVRWAVFVPSSNSKLIIATEAGVYTTNQINGAATVWQPSPSFPTVRTDMLKVRTADNTIVAATYGRGLFTAVIPVASLPVMLLNFQGRVQGNNTVLSWQTATEQNNRGFEIERSADGVNFSKIGFAGGAGNSSSLRSYTFTDKDIAQQISYYRLKQIDEDGNFEYSKIISISHTLTTKNPFTILNNPFRNTLDLQFGPGIQGKADIRVMDMNGRTVMRWSGQVQAGFRMRLQVPANMTTGIYNVQLLTNQSQFTVRVRKE